MRSWRAACLATLSGLAWPSLTLAQDVRVGGFAFLEATHREAKATPVNPDDLFNLSSDAFEAAALVEGDAAGFAWRVRAESFGTGDRWPDRTRLRLQELSYQRRIGERLSVSVGKQERSWDSGLAFRPLGFFRTNPDLRDITDSEGRQEGLPLISVTYVGDQFVAEAVVSDDLFGDIDNAIEARQWAARLSGQLGKLDASLVVRAAAGQRPGVGGSATYAEGAVEVHVDAYVGPSRRRRTHRGLIGTGGQDVADRLPAEPGASDPFVLDPGGRGSVLNGVVGVTWAPSSDLSLSAEYIHQDSGFSGRRWSAYLDLVASHRAALDTPAGGLAIANLAYDLGVLSGSVRRDYLFVLGRGSWKGIGMSASAFAGLADGSASLTASMSGKLSEHASAALTVTRLVGDRGSEFGLVPFGTIVSLSLRRSF